MRRYTLTDSLEAGAITAAGSLALACATYHFWENPIRFSRRLNLSLPRTLATSAAVVVGAATAAVALPVSAGERLQDEPFRTLAASNDSFQYSCEGGLVVDARSYCSVGGDLQSATTVLVLGDSHASQWFTVLSDTAADLGVRVLLRQANSCPIVGPLVNDDVLDEQDCRAFQAESLDVLEELRPRAVVLSDAHADTVCYLRTARRPASGSSPTTSLDPLVCLARGRTEQDCAPEPAAALLGARLFGPAEQRLRTDGVLDAVLDVNASLCTARECRLSDDGVYTFAASGHLTLPFTLNKADDVAAFLDALLQ